MIPPALMSSAYRVVNQPLIAHMSKKDYGRAECIRLLLVDNDIQYTEHTFTEKEFTTLKDLYPFSQVPCLKIDSFTIAQTGAILRYFGRKLDLYGCDNMEASFIDMIYDACKDIRNRYHKLIYEEFEEGKDNYVSHYLPRQITFLENVMNEKPCKGPYIAGTQPFSQVPCLKIDSITIAQTGAILRYFGRKLDLYGCDNIEASFIDMIYDACKDIRNRYHKLIYEEFEEGKDNYVSHYLPRQITFLENVMQEKPCKGPYIAGTQISFADYVLFEELDVHLLLDPESLQNAPTLVEFHEKMANRPRMKEYIEKRSERNIPVNGNGKQ